MPSRYVEESGIAIIQERIPDTRELKTIYGSRAQDNIPKVSKT